MKANNSLRLDEPGKVGLGSKAVSVLTMACALLLSLAAAPTASAEEPDDAWQSLDTLEAKPGAIELLIGPLPDLDALSAQCEKKCVGKAKGEDDTECVDLCVEKANSTATAENQLRWHSAKEKPRTLALDPIEATCEQHNGTLEAIGEYGGAYFLAAAVACGNGEDYFSATATTSVVRIPEKGEATIIWQGFEQASVGMGLCYEQKGVSAFKLDAKTGELTIEESSGTTWEGDAADDEQWPELKQECKVSPLVTKKSTVSLK